MGNKKGYKQTMQHQINLSEIWKDKYKQGYISPKLNTHHSEETKRKIGDANSIRMKEYHKNNRLSKKQVDFINNHKIMERCKCCGIIISNKNRIHNCKEIQEKVRLTHIGKNHSIEQKIKIRNSNIGKHNKGKERPLEIRIKLSKALQNYYKNPNSSKINSARQQGIAVEEWRGFTQPYLRRLRNSSKWRIWRELVFLRDNFTCQNKNCQYCNNKIGGMLHPHHIKPFALYPDLRFDINNGITYCKEYHLNSNLHKDMQKEVRIFPII